MYKTETDLDDTWTQELMKKLYEELAAEAPALQVEIAAGLCDQSLMLSAEDLAFMESSLPQPPAKPCLPAPPVALAAPPVGPTKSISIRIPHDVMDAIKREAHRLGTRHQTLMNQMLRRVSTAW